MGQAFSTENSKWEAIRTLGELVGALEAQGESDLVDRGRALIPIIDSALETLATFANTFGDLTEASGGRIHTATAIRTLALASGAPIHDADAALFCEAAVIAATDDLIKATFDNAAFPNKMAPADLEASLRVGLIDDDPMPIGPRLEDGRLLRPGDIAHDWKEQGYASWHDCAVANNID